MKPFSSILIACVLYTFSTPLFAQKKSKEPQITLEQVAEKCKGLARENRITVKVARFNVSTKSAQAHYTFGEELATMLTSALQQTNCFRVLEMNRNIADATGEMAMGQDGFTSTGSPSAGKMLGAQLIITGEVTDYTEGRSGTSVSGLEFGGNQATVGFTLKVLNPQTGELLFSKDINMKGSSSGFKGFSIGNFKTVGSTENRAVQDAVQKAIIKAVEILADNKENIDAPPPAQAKEYKKFTPQNCAVLRKGAPKVMILVTEATTAGTSRESDSYADLQRREREQALREREAEMNLGIELIRAFGGRKSQKNEEPAATKQSSATAEFKPVTIEQSTTETELTRHFVEAGFRVIDPKVYGKMNETAGGTDLGSMAALGLKMGANIIITGQAISERTTAQGGMTACRARLEIKVISTEDGSILATSTVAAGGIDVSEVIANKIALQNAALDMSQYLMGRICDLNIQSGSAPAGTQETKKAASGLNQAEVTIENAGFTQLQAIVNYLKTNSKIKTLRKSLTGKQGKVYIEHSTTTDQIAELLTSVKGINIEITGLDESSIQGVIK